MRATGNGLVKVCVQNLLATIRGEVPYDRLRGLDAEIVDRPSQEAVPEARRDAEWTLKTYEPRAVVEGIEVDVDAAASGDFAVTAHIR